MCFIIWIVPLWSKSLDFTSLGNNAVTSIFAKGWDSLGCSKKMVKETAKIGQKLNSLLLAKMPSLQFSPRDGIHYDFRKKWWKKLQKLARKWILYPTSTSKIIWYHPENNWGPIIDNLVQLEENFNSRKTSSENSQKTVGKHRKTAENIGKHLNSSDIILRTTEDPS